MAGAALLIIVMKPTENRAAIGALGGVLGLCLLLLLLAVRELVIVIRRPALAFDPSPSILRVLCITLAGTAVVAGWVVILTRRRDVWSCLLDADESIRLRLRLPAKRGRVFYESRRFTVLVWVLLGLFILAAVATVAAYFYFKSSR